jgi:hypothetical protein
MLILAYNKYKRDKERLHMKNTDTADKSLTTDKSLKKMSRVELLELLVEQSERMDKLEKDLKVAKTLIDRLDKELKTTKAQLNKREIAIESAGSIAEAALKLNGVFEAAQKAADQYLENVRMQTEASND